MVSPYHQAANGQVESAVKIIKSGLRRISGGTLETKLSRILLSPTGQHPIPQLELHQQNCWWKESYRQIWIGWGHPPLPLNSFAKIVRNSIMTKPPRCGCFTKARRFLHRTLTVASDGWYVWVGGTDALSFLIKLQDRRVILHHQDHMRACLCSSEPLSPTPVNNPRPEQIKSRLPPQPDMAPKVPIHTPDTVMPENPSVQKSTVAMSTPLQWSTQEIRAPECFSPG